MTSYDICLSLSDLLHYRARNEILKTNVCLACVVLSKVINLSISAETIPTTKTTHCQILLFYNLLEFQSLNSF